MLQLLDENEKIITQEIGQIKDKLSSFSIHNLNPGKYAIRYYQDENLNGTMETNKFGKPLEGYGFSNNVTAPFSMPPFEKWIFELKEDKNHKGHKGNSKHTKENIIFLLFVTFV